MKTTVFLTAALTLAAASSMSSCAPSGADSEFRQASGQAWGTYYSIKYNSTADLQADIDSVIDAVNLSLSPFREGSLVSRLNNGETVRADSMLAEVFDLSCRVCSLSGGVFDPTVAPLVNLWGFGYRDPVADVPGRADIDSALEAVGILQCSIAPDGTVVRKSPTTEFDFSAVAKGYGVDRVAAALRRAGCADYMVEIGGEIALAGKNLRGEDWVIQVDAPIEDLAPDSHTPAAYLKLTDICIATSGNYRNYRDTGQGRVGHTISPVTGQPVRTSTLSATVTAPTCALADALATACMAMEADDALAMIAAEPGVECMLVQATPDGALSIRTTPGFDRYISR